MFACVSVHSTVYSFLVFDLFLRAETIYNKQDAPFILVYVHFRYTTHFIPVKFLFYSKYLLPFRICKTLLFSLSSLFVRCFSQADCEFLKMNIVHGSKINEKHC